MLEAQALPDASLVPYRSSWLPLCIARASDEPTNSTSALDAWQELLDGAWVLLERVDFGSRSSLVARRTVQAADRHRALSKLELAVLESRSLATPLKQIALGLGLSEGHIAGCLRSGLEHLGLASQQELVALLAPDTPAAKARLLPPRQLEARRLTTSGGEVLVLSFPKVRWLLPPSLTPCESLVAEAVLSGDSNASIAQLRGVAERTIANQISAIFRKVEVRSRLELALALRLRED